MLKGGAADVQGKVETEAGIFDEADHLGGELLEGGIAADQPRPRELLLKVAGQTVGVVAEENGAHALVARGDQHQAERAFADRELDLRIGAAGAELAWRHAEHLR